MGKPSAPPAPDYVGAAKEQGVANVDAAKASGVLSNPNIISPLGNQTVSYGDTVNGVQQPTITRTLTPDAQATLDSQQQVQRALANLGLYGTTRAQQVMQQGFNPNLQPLQTGVDNNLVNRQQNSIIQRLQPQLDRQRASLNQNLANQGIGIGSEAYKNAQDDQARSENDLLLGANNQGFNQALAGAQFGNQAVGQDLSQQLGLYNQPLNQISALMSGSQIQMPQFQGYTGQNIQAAPLANATAQQGQYAQNLYNQQVGSYNNLMSGLFDVAGAAAMHSDIRLKSNIERVGTHHLGIGIYDYDIFGERQRGVMAHEVEKVMPAAVITDAHGYKMVKYGMLR